MIDLHGLRRRRPVLCLLGDRHFGNSHLIIRYFIGPLIDVGDMKCCSVDWMSLTLPGINPLKTKRRLLYLNTQSVPRCKHFSSRL